MLLADPSASVGTPSFETLRGILIVDGHAVIPVFNTSISIDKVENASI
jgi:hypothetical protein